MSNTKYPSQETLGQLLRRKLEEQPAGSSNVVHLVGLPLTQNGLFFSRQEALDELKDRIDGMDNIRLLTKKERRETQKFELAGLVHKHDLNFVYVREIDKATWDFKTTGGTTIAYKVGVKGGSVIEMSTAICCNTDNFDKLIGRLNSAKNFDKGARVKIKLPHAGMYTRQLEEMFESGF